MPVWIEVLQALLTPAIAMAVFVVAFMQWRTAHQKVVLDLFDRRHAVYREMEEAAVLFIKTFKQEERDRAAALARHAGLEAVFLFGPDAFKRISAAASQIRMYETISTAETIYSDEEIEARRDRNERRKKCVEAFLLEMPTIFEPYMRMTHKRVRSPAEWWQDKMAAYRAQPPLS